MTANENSRDKLKATLADNRSQVDHLNDEILAMTEKIQSLKSQHQLSDQEKSFKNADLKRISEQIKLTDKQIADYQVKLTQSVDAGSDWRILVSGILYELFNDPLWDCDRQYHSGNYVSD